MKGKFGCCYKLRSFSQTDNEVDIIILQLLEIVRITENKEVREREIKRCCRNGLWYAGFLLLIYFLFFLFFLALNQFTSNFLYIKCTNIKRYNLDIGYPLEFINQLCSNQIKHIFRKYAKTEKKYFDFNIYRCPFNIHSVGLYFFGLQNHCRW